MRAAGRFPGRLKRSYKATSLRDFLGVGQKEAKKGEDTGERGGIQGVIVSVKPGLGKDRDVKSGPTGGGGTAGNKMGEAEGLEPEGWVAVNDPPTHRAKERATEPEPAVGGEIMHVSPGEDKPAH